MSCSEPGKDEPREVEYKDVTLVEIEDDIEPPPPGLDTHFKSVQEWLCSICDAEKPDKSISIFKIGLFESSDGNMLYLAGVNKYENGDTSHTRVDFEPSNMYCRLPESGYKDLNREQLLVRLTGELKAFTGTEKFRNSFLATSNTIIFESNGQVIWANK
ncbi:hypothetical protein LZZ85_10585 [Terrimonas sp. NA20]|uniref:DUF306 domain-containing protein n=1 Tax=Terrimonas ginsenosidimutans TaxID=2908004 RepID=A0ABS9KQY8_9BACT|nr:hypothetical protein [Terrimonas ginsenosidimutans]MCG2614731.1 hypothetical protein [Terrimonas ginsenosidimutans]